jgi:hypothetical protein
MQNDAFREWLEEKFRERPLNRNIAELGIVTNEKSTRPDNVLEAEKLVDAILPFLQGQQSSFAVKTSGIAGQGTIRPDHPMTRDYDGQRIMAHGAAHRLGGRKTPIPLRGQLPGQFAIGSG